MKHFPNSVILLHVPEISVNFTVHPKYLLFNFCEIKNNIEEVKHVSTNVIRTYFLSVSTIEQSFLSYLIDRSTL